MTTNREILDKICSGLSKSTKNFPKQEQDAVISVIEEILIRTKKNQTFTVTFTDEPIAIESSDSETEHADPYGK